MKNNGDIKKRSRAEKNSFVFVLNTIYARAIDQLLNIRATTTTTTTTTRGNSVNAATTAATEPTNSSSNFHCMLCLLRKWARANLVHESWNGLPLNVRFVRLKCIRD